MFALRAVEVFGPQPTDPGLLLVVNDNQIQLDAMRLFLTCDEFTVLTADSAESALEILQTTKPDLIISDVVMPQIDGIELCRRVRSDPATADIPVLLFSGLRYDDAGITEGLEAGADDYIESDAPPSLLRKKAERLIAQARERRARLVAEAALRESEYQYRLLFDCNPHPMWVYDQETLQFVIVNDAAVRHYGYSKQEFLQMTIKDIHLKEDVSLLIDKLSNQFAQVENSDTWKHRKKDGTLIDVEITSHEIPFQERKARLVLATDTTERKHLEEQLFLSQKMEAIGRLAGGIAHDFNNLLTAILGYGQLLLLDIDEDDPKRSHVEQIQKAGQSAASLTGQLLAFSRKQVLQPIVLDLNSVVANLGKMLQRMIGEDVNLMIIAHPALGYVKADPGQIEQVIMNLAINARDAMPRGGKLTIETLNVDLDEAYAREHVSVNPGSFIMLAVSDTGSGMDKETQARIFEPFFTTKGIGKGTGLGLSTVYGIVKQSGGNIWVYSEPDRGTTFKIYLPRVDEEPSPFTQEADKTGSQGSETILLIEDDQDVRRLARAILQMNGYRVLEAERESEALLICEQQDEPIHLMISDVVMPKLSGPILAEQLSRLRPEMKVLFMSGYTDEAIVHHGILGPGTAFLQKPFTPQALTSKVRQVLNQP